MALNREALLLVGRDDKTANVGIFDDITETPRIRPMVANHRSSEFQETPASMGFQLADIQAAWLVPLGGKG